MGKVAKKIVEDQKANAERTEKLIGDLIWYTNEMNKCIKVLVDALNENNAILMESYRAFRED